MFKEFFEKESTRKCIYFSIIVIIMYFLRSMFNILLLTFIFAYLIDTTKMIIVNKLKKFVKVSPKLVAGGIYILMATLLVVTIIKYIPIAVNQSVALMQQVYSIKPEDFKYINKILQDINQDINIGEYMKVGVNTLVSGATHIGKSGVNVFIASILSLFFVLQKENIRDFMKKFENSKIEPFYRYVSHLGNSFLNSFGKVIQAQMVIALINTAMSIIGLYIIGFKSLIALGIMIFALSLIPVIGVVISLVPLSLMALQLGGVIKVIYVLIMIIIIHVFESYVVNPKVMSHKTNLPIFFTFITLIVSEHFMGAWGLLLGIPIVIFILDMLGVNLSSDKEKIEKNKVNSNVDREIA